MAFTYFKETIIINFHTKCFKIMINYLLFWLLFLLVIWSCFFFFFQLAGVYWFIIIIILWAWLFFLGERGEDRNRELQRLVGCGNPQFPFYERRRLVPFFLHVSCRSTSTKPCPTHSPLLPYLLLFF